eukprot:gene12632-14601_t
MLINLLFVALLGVSAVFADEAAGVLQEAADYVKSLDEFDHEWKHECHMANGEACDIRNFPKDETTMVFPGGETRCIFSNTPNFAFQVVPGDSDKLLFYFQGGGACWDETSTKFHLCRSRATPLPELGVFNRRNRKNKFRDHTIVHVLYCSGDVHGGNVVRTYNDRWGVPVEQKGLANAQSVLDWTKQMQATGALASTFSELVVMGCSAGSIGAQLWGKQVVSALKWQRAAVVPDSYAGIFPEGSSGPLMYNFGFCSSGFLSEALLAKCLAKELTIEEMDLEFMAATPTVPYTFIQSKVDVVQRSFFRAIAFTGNYSDNAMSPAIFYDDVSTLFGSYNTHLDNFLVYLVDGHNHCYTPRETFYLTDATSPWDNGKGSEGIMLHDWTAQLPLRNGASISTVCAGEVKPTQGLQTPLQMPSNDSNAYCSSSIVPKTFKERY